MNVGRPLQMMYELVTKGPQTPADLREAMEASSAVLHRTAAQLRQLGIPALWDDVTGRWLISRDADMATAHSEWAARRSYRYQVRVYLGLRGTDVAQSTLDLVRMAAEALGLSAGLAEAQVHDDMADPTYAPGEQMVVELYEKLRAVAA